MFVCFCEDWSVIWTKRLVVMCPVNATWKTQAPAPPIGIDAVGLPRELHSKPAEWIHVDHLCHSAQLAIHRRSNGFGFHRFLWKEWWNTPRIHQVSPFFVGNIMSSAPWTFAEFPLIFQRTFPFDFDVDHLSWWLTAAGDLCLLGSSYQWKVTNYRSLLTSKLLIIEV